ncbi:MAG: phycobiliprotein lyase [Synechococcales bacterium]|nr:phycobiliprotein lyase [Synechococcales bacterium]
MDIQSFFEQSCGKWFCQRTSQHLTYNQSEWSRTDVWIELLPNHDQAVVDLCQQQGQDAAQAVCGVAVRWEGFVGADPSKQVGRTLLVPLADGDEDGMGSLLRQTLKPQPITTLACYVLDDSGILTIVSEEGGMRIEEKAWFVSENLRLRSSLLQRPGRFDTTSFFSEIRVGGAS